MKTTLLNLMLTKGYFRFEEIAKTYILSGQVLVNGQRETDPQTKVSKHANIEILDMASSAFSSQSHKVALALKALGVEATQKIAIDFLACRGGTTEALIACGAKHVFAFGESRPFEHKFLTHNSACTFVPLAKATPVQMVSTIAHHAQGATLAVLHSEALSLKAFFPYLRQIVPGGDIILHLKPLLELDDFWAKKLGVISQSTYLPFLKKIISTINDMPNLAVQGICPSEDTYYSKHPEFFFHLLSGQGVRGFDLGDDELNQVIQKALEHAHTKPQTLQNTFNQHENLKIEKQHD